MLRRRGLFQLAALGGLGCAWPAIAGAQQRQAEPRHAVLKSPHFSVSEVRLPHASGVAERFVMMTPRHTAGPVPLLVLLHGLGETGDERTGMNAWLARYGLGSSYERLLAPPVEPLYSKQRYWRAGRVASLNAQLEAAAFRGMCIVCPYTPNVYKARSRARMLDQYTSWLTEQVVPYAKQHAKVLVGRRHVHLNGCSLGGYVGIEVLLRAPQHFGPWGSVQGALGKQRVSDYAKRLATLVEQHGKRPMLLETSDGDPFRAVNEQLSAALLKRALDVDLRVLKGPHNQPFLRDSGTLEMLLWHDRLPRG